jgi:hypothetical protein
MQCFFQNHWWWLCDAQFKGNETGFWLAVIGCVVIFPAAIVWLSSKMNGRMK